MVGSLLRPPELIEAFAAYSRGENNDSTRVEVEDACIVNVVAEQQRRGLPLVTDGEYRRIGYMQSFSDLAGLMSWRENWAHRLSLMTRQDDEGGEHRDADPSMLERARTTERLRLVRNRPLEEFRRRSRPHRPPGPRPRGSQPG
jgi:5-methyltetrahydropteroyltriglutamate--homocysteine methyltransferase